MAARRTTIINLVDDELQQVIDEANEGGEDTVLVSIFDEQFEITTDVNSWLMMKMIGGDMGVIVDLMQSIIKKHAHPGLTGKKLEEAEERDRENLRRLDAVMMRQRNLKPEVLIGILGKALGIVSERPTKSPSGSSSGVKRAAVSKRSAAAG